MGAGSTIQDRLRTGARGAVLALAAAATLVGAPPARADEEPVRDRIVLTDGRTITGEVVAEDADFISIRADGVLRAYPKANVTEIHRAPPEEAAGTGRAGVNGPGTSAPPPEPARAERRKRRRAAQADAPPAPPELGPQARAWLVDLLNRVQSPAAQDPAVRASLAAALRALGPAAVPGIRAAAETADEEPARLLRRVADAMAGADRPTADAPPSPEIGRKGHPGDLVATLGLSREQARRAREVLRDHLTARRDIARDARAAGSDRKAVAEQLAELRRATLGALRELLDADQAARFDEDAERLLRGFEERQRGDAPGGKRGKAPKNDADEAPRQE